MTLKETLDQVTKIIRALQYKDHPKEDLIGILQNLVILVGQVLVQRDDATEKLKRYDRQLWLSHIMGQVECPECNCGFPIDFYVGSKGVDGKPLTAATQDELIELLEFPPITQEDLKNSPIPDFMPDL
tara:strand:+ start:162 stop:545 length:384 start_codon:yes stop_codon:yes gene_type:complete